MQWRKVPGFPDYEVSEAGDVRRLTDGRRYRAGHWLKRKPHARGYQIYCLHCDGRAKDILVHRVVALAFLGEPPTEQHEVAHDDGTRMNNHWRNLRWALPAENQADRKRHGTFMAGDTSPASKITEAQADAIRAEYSAGGVRYRGGAVTMATLAAKHGISLAQVSRIVNGTRRASRAA